MVEPLHVRPVLLGIDRNTLGCADCHVAVECLREDLINITLVAGDSIAVGKSNSDRRYFFDPTRRGKEGGAGIEETRPIPWGLRGRPPPTPDSRQGVSTI